MGIPLVIHEQNAVAGTADRFLARFARRRVAGFPGALPGAVVVGSPVRAAFKIQSKPEQRYGQRTGRLRLLVLGGSLGAAPLNKVLPEALAAMPVGERPQVVHQTGTTHIEEVRDRKSTRLNSSHVASSYAVF